MPRMRRKADLPTKLCPQCGRPFAWRRAWARGWDAVIYCSDRCRGAARAKAPRKTVTPDEPAPP